MQTNLEQKYKALRTDLSDFVSHAGTQISDEDLFNAYPLQAELQSSNERYSNQEFLAAGGVKNIYSIYDTLTGRFVAKAILKDSSDKVKVESFLKEARLMASLQHPNIIPIYDMGLGDDGGAIFYNGAAQRTQPRGIN